MSGNALEVRSIVKQFASVRAVDGLSFTIEPGEIFALLGPNGAGKTTTVRMLTGIIRPDEGSIAFAGGAATLPPSALGYLPEDRGLYKEISPLRTLVYFGVLRGLTRREARLAAHSWLERLDLADRCHEKLDALSKGNQQKVQFIASILHRPSFVILDEPFSGLDPVNQDFFLDLIREFRDAGVTVLLSAHQMQLVERLAERILLIDRGRAVLQGALDEIRRGFGADEKLILGLDREPDLAELAGNRAIELATRTAEREVALHVRAGESLSSVLVALSTRYGITAVRSEHISLHDIYVQTIRNTNGEDVPTDDSPTEELAP